ncbi:hypothetical protein [Streptomyces huiliensis]|uniref:hypothetical protein n=1 Tax=Streptomyces huiliensis TaxID=2876027 RepID=UPI001CBEB4C9|nr:hypothetical protein [Streptomyces huiliensis]
MPTPFGSHGGMAFSADELRVLRRALAIALQPRTENAEKQSCLRLAQAVEEAAREGGRLRAFLRADLARYRAALPGTAPGYVERLQDALAAGHRPGAEDLAALRALCATPAGAAETGRRRALLQRCERLAGAAVRARLTDCTAPGPRGAPANALLCAPAVPAARPREALHDALPPTVARDTLPPTVAHGAVSPTVAHDTLPPTAGPEAPKPGARPAVKPGPAPGADRPKAPPAPASPRPGRPIPTPGEVFPPRRKPVPPAEKAVCGGAARGTEVRGGPSPARA